MIPDNLKFGGGFAETHLHPAVLAAMLIAILLMFVLPRKFVMVPFLFFTFLTPLGQVWYVSGAHVHAIRILIFAGCVRMAWTKFFSPDRNTRGFSSLDTLVLCWVVFRTTAFMLLYRESAAVLNQFGFLWDVLGGYFLLRFLIQDPDDIQRAIKCFAVLAIVLAAAMLNEQRTGHNIFSLWGGASTLLIREGRIRSQAVFGHALLAGAFGATLFPLFVLLWKSSKAKFLAFAAMMSSIVMVVTSVTSTAVMAFVAGVFALMCWPFRRKMRIARWGIVILLLALSMVMKAPVWYVISHIDVTGGSSGYQRAELLDRFIRHFGDWWLVGTKSAGTWGWDMWDTSNQYVTEGEDGGLAAFICFVSMIVVGFRWIGMARKSAEGDSQKEWYYWLLGAALFSHTIGFFGISYFDQTRVAWYALLVIISVATAPVLAAKTARASEPAGGLPSARQAISASPVGSVPLQNVLREAGPRAYWKR
jgi:hypothetical protein